MSSDLVAAISSLISFWPQIIKLKSASCHPALLHCLPVYKALCLHQKCYWRKTTKKSQIWAIFPVLHRFQNCCKSCQPLDMLIAENNLNTGNLCHCVANSLKQDTAVLGSWLPFFSPLLPLSLPFLPSSLSFPLSLPPVSPSASLLVPGGVPGPLQLLTVSQGERHLGKHYVTAFLSPSFSQGGSYRELNRLFPQSGPLLSSMVTG